MKRVVYFVLSIPRMKIVITTDPNDDSDDFFIHKMSKVTHIARLAQQSCHMFTVLYHLIIFTGKLPVQYFQSHQICKITENIISKLM